MADEWYYIRGSTELGPITADQIVHLNASGHLRPTDLVWQKNTARVQQPAKFLVANLIESQSQAEGQRLLTVAVNKRLVGAGVSTGNWHDACAAQREATLWSLAALTAQSVPDHSEAHEGLFTLATCYFDLGVLYQSAGRFSRAEWAFDAAFVVRERLARSAPQKPEYQQALAASFNQRGLLHHDLGVLDEARASIGKAVAIRRQLLRTHPADLWTAVLLGGTLCNLGAVLCDQGRYPEALDQYEQAIPLIEGQLAKLTRGRVGNLGLALSAQAAS